MFIAKVIGNVWSTNKHPSLLGSKLLIVSPLDAKTRKVQGEPTLALDVELGAGPGDVVLVMDEGSSARQILKNKKAPVRTVICGIIDEVCVNGEAFRN